MKITDRIYGDVEIDEPVLIKIINSKPLQRLKGVNQAGASKYAISYKDVTRYEHSLGVMILLKKLGASVEEQIAGLMHDIPHTAFSHVVDFVFKNDKHEFHEKFHEKIISNSEIPMILKEFGFKVERLFDEHNFSLLERNLPDLCADRLDYTLRDLTSKIGFSEKVNDYINSFIARDGEIIINDESIAKKFAEEYLFMDESDWSNPLEVAFFQLLADAVKIALEKNIITQDDLFQDDNFVYEKLKNSNEPKILKKLEMLNPKLKIVDDPKNYDFYSRTKLRYIDPKFLRKDGTLARVSEVYPKFKERLEQHKELILRGNFVKIVSW